MKKIIKTTALQLLVLLMVFWGFPVHADKESQLEVKMSVGFNDVYKIGYSTPVNLTIKNNGKDINGEVEIRVPSSPGKYMSYLKPISLQKGSEKAITINIPIGNDNRNKYAVNIYDGDDLVYEDSITTMASNNVTNFIGILSDDFDSLSYINKVPAPAGVSLVTKNIKLDEKNFPEDIFTLDAFNVIVINDFDTSRFSKVQYEVLKQWVKNGGTLILGTGSKYNKTLSVFKDNFIEGSQGSVKEVSTSKIYELGTNGDNKNETKVDILTLTIKDSRVTLEDKGEKLVQALTIGKGVVGIMSFDLGKAPFVNWTNSTIFMERILSSVNPQLSNSGNINSYQLNFRNNKYGIQESVTQFSEMATAKTSNYYIVLFIYILVVAPISYFVLKKLDKREWMWLTVPVIALIFGVAVYTTGTGTRLSKVTTNMVSYISLDKKGNASIDTFAGVFNTNRAKVKITGNNGEKIIPVSDSYYSNQPDKKEVQEAKIFSGDNGGIEYINSSLLETKILQIQSKAENIGKLEADIRLKIKRIRGTIKNSTGLDLKDCMIIMPEGYYKIPSLKNGDTVNVDSLTYTPYNGIYDMINREFFSNSYNGGNSVDKKRNMDLRQEGNILQRLFDYGNSPVEGIKFIGFSNTQIHNSLYVNGVEARKNERNILIAPLDVSFADGDKIEYPIGFVPYEVVNSSYLNFDPMNKRFYGNGSAEIVFSLDNDMLVEEIEISTSQMFSKSTKSNYYIYNVSTQEFDPLQGSSISGEALKNYLSFNNIVKLKLEVVDGDVVLPQMAAKGRAK